MTEIIIKAETWICQDNFKDDEKMWWIRVLMVSVDAVSTLDYMELLGNEMQYWEYQWQNIYLNAPKRFLLSAIKECKSYLKQKSSY